jgi:hypothetical protein
MRKFLLMLLAGLLLIPGTGMAAPSIEELQKQIAEIAEQLDELEDRVEKPERHTALDRIEWYGDIRTKVDSLHYNNVTWNPGIKLDYAQFGADMAAWTALAATDPRVANALADLNTTLSGFSAAQNAIIGAGQAAAGAGQPISPFMLAPSRKTTDINNDILYTTRLRLGMKAKIAKNMSFIGRLSMYKNWGDSTGTKVFDSWNAFTMDGTNGGNTTGDFLRVERAMFNWKDIGGSPFYLSIGRRPSTYGAPSNYRENVKRGGTPSGHMMHFNFDGITIGYKMEELTGLEGSVLRFCYGQGFESEWGNGELFNNQNNTADTHIGGFNFDAYDDGQTLVQIIAFRAMDVNDGFKGTFAFPSELAAIFAPGVWNDAQAFPNINFVTRYTPSTVIGDINLAGINVSHEMINGFTWFGSFGMTQLESNGKAGLFGGMGNDAIYNATLSDDNGEIFFAPVRAEDSETHEGYGVYVGIQTPAPMGKFGLEYNYGSQYWTPFTQAADDALGSKLATRGHAAEAYYIFEVNRNAFIKLGGIFYDYEYTGSGSPVGKPVKISDIQSGSEFNLMPVVDTAWDAYAQMSLKW